jgi:nucleoside-diphosphate-sugar epimerase
VISSLGSGSEIVFTPRPEDDPEVRCPDISLAREELGWRPTITLREGLDKTIAWARTAWQTSR